MEETQTALQLHNPSDIVRFGSTLKKFIAEQGLSVEIQGTNYVMVDGWKFAGLNFGLTAIPSPPVKESDGTVTLCYGLKNYKDKKTGQWASYEAILDICSIPEEIELMRKEPGKKEGELKYSKFKTIKNHKYSCSCDVIRISTGEKVSSGYAICSNEEILKAGFDEYAVLSMAQTRAIAKAYRNIIGFIMKAAGFSDTPAEEMDPTYVTTEKDELFDDAIEMRIEKFETTAALVKWVNEDCEYLWQHKGFQAAVQAKKAQLKKAGK